MSETKLLFSVSRVTKQVRQLRNEKEKDFLKPPRSLLARLSPKKANNAPLNVRGIPCEFNVIPVLAKLLMSTINGCRTWSRLCFSMTGTVATIARLIILML